MKNIIISLSIFIITIITILLSLNYLNKVCTELNKNVSSLEDLVNNEDWDSAKKQSISFLSSWERYANQIAVFVHHEEIDNINTEVEELSQYIKSEDKEEALVDISVIKFYIIHINKFEKINIQNIF